ncbi:MAG: ABC transporter ATP-binding protein [Microbacterium sp.]|jgi:peptide/nickel transport system ATP-binding protein|uniref:ABC transporter ATP-binding protein n=1 Tax=Microbacterium sp. TaxID=51671 RepID=UPI002828B29D|nr:ABC transporter ATP-binding protein [Microbacterium sp.]MDR2322739.1 ABC transporter ATP-binding protein [Microbacterium sp.]
MGAALQVRGLRILTNEGAELVRDLDLDLAPGERLGLVGESGSGKTLTGLALLGLLPPGLTATGSIRLDGTELLGAGERVLQRVRGSRIAAVFQDPSSALDPLMRVGDQLARPLRRHRGLQGAALRSAVRAAAEEVRLPDPERLLQRYPFELSGGQRQRVAIAMALACRPDVLLADEPTTALDVTVQATVLELLDDAVRRHGTSLVFVSHDLAVVAGIAERAIVLRRGEAVEEGTAQRIVTAPEHEYTRRLVAAARELESALDRLSGGGEGGRA